MEQRGRRGSVARESHRPLGPTRPSPPFAVFVELDERRESYEGCGAGDGTAVRCLCDDYPGRDDVNRLTSHRAKLTCLEVGRNGAWSGRCEFGRRCDCVDPDRVAQPSVHFDRRFSDQLGRVGLVLAQDHDPPGGGRHERQDFPADGRRRREPRPTTKLLHDVGFLDRLRPRVSRTQGSCEWIYRLTDRGWRALLDAGAAVDGQDYTPAELTSISYVEHDVQVAALVTRLAALAARAWRREGALIDAAPFRLVGPRAGTIDPRYEKAAPERSERAAQWPIAHLGRANPGVLKPDATLIWEVDGYARLAVMIEYDRTRRATKQLRRLRHYDWFISEGWPHSRYSTLFGEPILLVVCADERQLQPFVQAADAELTAWLHEGVGSQREDSRHPGREQVGFTTRERLTTGNWELRKSLRDHAPSGASRRSCAEESGSRSSWTGSACFRRTSDFGCQPDADFGAVRRSARCCRSSTVPNSSIVTSSAVRSRKSETKHRFASPRSTAPTRLRCIRASKPNPSWLTYRRARSSRTAGRAPRARCGLRGIEA